MRTVFLSSVVNGFEQYGDAAALAIDSVKGFKCVRMEQFAASSVPALDTCLQHLRQCDYYAGILGARYGSLHSPSGCSYTEAEYDEAVRLGIPRLMFLAGVGPLFVETADCVRLQQEFRGRVSNDLFRGEFETLDGLRAAITQSLAALAMKSEPDSLDSKTVTWLFVPSSRVKQGTILRPPDLQGNYFEPIS